MKPVRLAIVAVMGFILIGCSKKPEEQIIGKWEAVKSIIRGEEEAVAAGELIFDFQKDGKVAVTDVGKTDHVTYKFIDKENMEFTEPDGTPFSVKASISGDSMTLEIPQANKKFELKRIK